MIMAEGVRLRGVTPWPYNDRPAGFSLPDFGLSPEQHAPLTDDIWAAIVRGVDDADEFVESYLEDEEDFPLTEEQLRELFELTREARLSQQAGWTAEETE